MLRRRSEVCQQALRTVSRSHRHQHCTSSPTTATSATVPPSPARRRICSTSGSHLRHHSPRNYHHGDPSQQTPSFCVSPIPPVPILPASRNSMAARHQLSFSSLTWDPLPSKTCLRSLRVESQHLHGSIKRRLMALESSKSITCSSRITSSSPRYANARPHSCLIHHYYYSPSIQLQLRSQQPRLYHGGVTANNAILRKHRPDYDPVLAIMMERWIQRSVLTGSGRRPHSSLAKPLPNSPVVGAHIASSPSISTSTPTSSTSTMSSKETVSTSVTTVSGSAIQKNFIVHPKQPRHSHVGATQTSKVRCDDPLSVSSISITQTVSLSDKGIDGAEAKVNDRAMQEVVDQFRQSLNAIDVQDYALPIEFRSLSQETTHHGKKGFIPGSIRKCLGKIWNDFLTIASDTTCDAGAQLTAMDYTQLLKVIRYSGKAKESSGKILEVETILKRAKIPLTHRMAGTIARAHLLRGSVQEAVRVYEMYAQTIEKRSIEHDRILSVMVDGFVTSQRFSEGTRFLDWVLDPQQQDPILVQELYKRLLSHQLRSKEIIRSYSPKVHGAIRFFNNLPFPPTATGLGKTLSTIELDPESDPLIEQFSQSFGGRLVKMRDPKLMTPLILGLLKKNKLEEVARILKLMKGQDVSPELDQIRIEILRSMAVLHPMSVSETMSEALEETRAPTVESITRAVEREGLLDQWDWMVQQQGVFGYNASEKENLIPGFKVEEAGYLAAPREYEYSQVIARCLVKEKDAETALRAAQYMRIRGWTVRGIDFWKMNSAMVNFADSNQYGAYLELRYVLGGSAKPDLHTYRRLVYAACRRSDLRSALTLYKELRNRHEDWTLDSTFYNAIISTAGATGLVAVAEKTFQCMLEDGIQPDHYSFHGLLNGYCQQKDLEAALLIPGHMVKWKLEPNTETFNLMIKAYLSSVNPNISTSRRLLKVMQASKSAVPPDLVTFNQLLDGYRRVENTGWFDHFFDRYFAPPSSSPVSDGPASNDLASESEMSHEGDVEALGVGGRPSLTPSDPSAAEATAALHKGQAPIVKDDKSSEVRPGRGDDKTLLVQLKYSLSLPDVDLATVWELWKAIQPKIRTREREPSKFKTVDLKPPTWKDSLLKSSEEKEEEADALLSGMGSQTELETGSDQAQGVSSRSSSSLPKTHVPFKKWLGSTLVQATDEEQFQFMVLKIFRDAFETRGDTKGVKQMEKIQKQIFGSHPEVVERQASRVKSTRPSRSGKAIKVTTGAKSRVIKIADLDEL